MPTFNVCDTVTVSPGESFTWNNPFPQAVKITAGTTWFLPEPYIIVPPNNGKVSVAVPANAAVGTYNLTVTFLNGENACPGAHPKIIVRPAK